MKSPTVGQGCSEGATWKASVVPGQEPKVRFISSSMVGLTGREGPRSRQPVTLSHPKQYLNIWMGERRREGKGEPLLVPTLEDGDYKAFVCISV